MKKSNQVIFGVLVSVMTVFFACAAGFAAPQDLKIGSNKVGTAPGMFRRHVSRTR